MATYFDDAGVRLVDLTKRVTSDEEAIINDAIFSIKPKTGSSGTGLIQSFVRLQATGDEDGYNTSGRPINDPDVNTSLSFTHDLLLGDVPIRTINGTQYFEFLLDINQTNSNPLVSLDELQIFTSASGGYTGSLAGLGTPLYDLDADGDTSVLLDYSLQSGSGVSDMYFYVKVSDILDPDGDGVNNSDPNNTYVYLYSKFGEVGTLDASDEDGSGDLPDGLYGSYSSNDGFEEWAVAKTIPGVEFSGYKWFDADADGIWDNGEVALPGWQINYTINFTIDLKGNEKTNPDQTGSVTFSVVTDANGKYTLVVPSVESLLVGDYDAGDVQSVSYTLTVYETLQDPSVWANTYGGYIVGSNIVNPTVLQFTDAQIDGQGGDEIDRTGDFGIAQTLNFGNTQLGSIRGTKYEDANGDGETTGDDGIAEWTIYLFNSDPGDNPNPDDAFQTTVTDGDGLYIFEGLLPGTYWVVEADEDGWIATTPTQIQVVGTGTAGFDITGQNFANFELFDITGTKYDDTDGDGEVDEGEPGLSGWTIFIDSNDNDVLDGDEKSAVTDADGNWVIEDLDASYNGDLVKEINQAGWVQTLGPVSGIVATSGNDGQVFDFANFADMNLSGYKFEDLNGDEDWNGGDDGLSGWTIVIDTDTDPTNGYLLADDTDGDGKYEFSGLNVDTAIAANGTIPAGVLGDYAGQTLYVYEVGQSDWTQTYDGSFSFTIESGYTHTGDEGDAEEGNFGNFELFDITGTKYDDTDGDGEVDEGEPGLAGWTIFIDSNDNDALDPGEKFAVTSDGTTDVDGDGDIDPAGSWVIKDLDASYNGALVKEINQAGWVQTLGPVSGIVATSGNDGQVFDFANFADMNLSGYKWGDANGDGIWNEAPEAGLEGWSIVIDNDQDPNNGYLLVDVTDADGKYEFSGLNPFTTITANGLVPAGELGDYIGQTLYVYELQQNGFTQTYGGYDFVITSGFEIVGTAGETEDGNFGNTMLCGANRTPGFWQSTLGRSFYDGILNNQGDANGDGKPDGNKDFEAEGWSETDLLELYGVDLLANDSNPNTSDNDHFILWDEDGDGVEDAGVDVFLTVAELQSWVSGGPKGGNDFLSILERDVAATFLNTLNNNEVCGDGGEPALQTDIADDYEAAIDFILKYDPDFNGVASGNKKAQQADWKAYGSDAHLNLAAYNESGEAMVDGKMTQIAMDGDDYSSPFVQDYLATMSNIGADMHASSMLPPDDLLAQTQTLQVA